MIDIKFLVNNKEAVKEKTIKAGWVTYVGKGCTEYGICFTAVTLANCVLHDEKRIMATSCPLDGEYGESGIFIGCPAVVGENGVEQVVEFNLPEDELAEFKKCCATVRANIKRAEAIWKK